MADSAYIPGVFVRGQAARALPRHAGLVRVTHWVGALSFAGLLVSGAGILLAHPRFYWGETGGLGTPSLFDLPLPFMLGGPSGWGRYLHFQSAWACVLNGLVYLAWGLATGHFLRNLAPMKADLNGRSVCRVLSVHVRFRRPAPEEALSYNVVQRITYLAVTFFLFPLMLWTGLAMSPAVTSVFPILVTALGGRQCARTIHFFGTLALLVFVIVHITMVWRAGFRGRVGAMITGRAPAGKDRL